MHVFGLRFWHLGFCLVAFDFWLLIFGLCLLAFLFDCFGRFCIGRWSAWDVGLCVLRVWALRLGFSAWASVLKRQHLGKCLGFSRLGFGRLGF